MTRSTGSGRTGRPALPANVRRLRGDTNVHQGPVPRSGEVKPPSWLDRDGRKAWRSLAPEMERLHLLTPVDVPAFAAMCNEWAGYVRAAKLVNESGPLIKSRRDGVRKNPAAQVARDHLTAFNVLAGQFGLTPAARQRLIVEAERETGRGPERLLSPPSA